MSERRLIKGTELSKFYWRFQEEFLFSTTDFPRNQKILAPHGNRTRNFTNSRTEFDSQPEDLGVAFFATGPGLGLIMYIFTTIEFSTHNLDFHLKNTHLFIYTLV